MLREDVSWNGGATRAQQTGPRGEAYSSWKQICPKVEVFFGSLCDFCAHNETPEIVRTITLVFLKSSLVGLFFFYFFKYFAQSTILLGCSQSSPNQLKVINRQQTSILRTEEGDRSWHIPFG